MQKSKKIKNKQKINDNPLIGKLLISLFLGFLDSYKQSRKAVYVPKFNTGVNKLNKLAKQRGKAFALKHNKLCRLAVTRYLSGKPLPKDTPHIKLNEDGLPVFLLDFNPIIRTKNPEDLQTIFTMLNLTRGVTLKPDFNTKSITDTWEGKLPPKWYTLRSAVKYSLKLKRLQYSFGGLHTSTKSGPIGQAMLFATYDGPNLPTLLKEALVKLGGKSFEAISTALDSVCSGLPLYQQGNVILDLKAKKATRFRKLSFFGDKEGKTRVIGILDYGSQAVLRSIHKDLERFLRGIPEDCTFDQQSWYTKLPTGKTYYSFDLSNATDRLPIKHQEDIMCIIYGKRVSQLWAYILTNYSFTSVDLNDEITYHCGQPMGAYSSGPIMALQHHALIHYAALLANKSPKGQYVVLGDDVVICDDKIAEMYQTVISELKVQISPQKTHISKDICEFAKRWFFKGSEISAFPLHSMKNNLKRYYLLQNTLMDARGKGYILGETSEKEAMIKLIKLTGKKSQAPRIGKLYKLFDLIVNKIDNTDEYYGLIMNFIKANGKVPQENIDLYFNDLTSFKDKVNEIMEDLFLDLTSEGNQEMMDMKDHEKTGTKVINQLGPDKLEDFRSSIPIFLSFRQAWQKRTDMLQLYYKKYANDKNMLKASLVFLGDLPTTSSRIVNTRNYHSISASHSRLVKTLLSSLTQVEPHYENDEDGFASFKTIDSSEFRESG